MTAIAHTLNFASHATIIAVKPRPPAVLVEIVWEEPLTRINPAIPAIPPEIPTVRTMTFPTLIHLQQRFHNRVLFSSCR